MNAKSLVCLAALGLMAATPLAAQLTEPNAAGVAMGHMHLAVRDVDAQKAFWTGMMGGKIVKNGPLEMVELPGVYLLFRQAENPDPPAGSVVDHFGVVVKDMPGTLEKWKAAGLEIEPTQNPNEVFVHAPDNIRIEVYGVPDLPVPIQMNHIHYFVSDIPGMQAWYADTFGAVATTRLCIACLPREVPIQVGNLPGMINLSFSNGAADLAGTRGRAIDHVGFEIQNLEAFVKKLEAKGIKMDSQIREIPDANLKIAFLTDPWGTYIELTEGLAPRQ